MVPGVTTEELDRICHDYIVNVQHAIPAQPQLPGLSEDDLHLGEPRRLPRHSRRPRLKSGDIVNIDVTVIQDGFHGDTSRMYFVGKPAVQRSA